MKEKILVLFFLYTFAGVVQCNTIELLTLKNATEQEQFARSMLGKQLIQSGYETDYQLLKRRSLRKENILLIQHNAVNHRNISKLLRIDLPSKLDKEGFFLLTKGNTTLVYGADGNGVIYGACELVDRLKAGKDYRVIEPLTDAPEMVLRGTAIGIQKPYYLPGRTVYEYPYTPENFPWFYDKVQWIEYLDMLVSNRMNSLYLWNGHPFASLVRLPDYPFAVEVDEQTFRLNEDMYSFLTHEAAKRGIYVIQMFYNIIVSKPFAEHYGIKTQDRHRPITPLLSDYMRKSITAFIEKYPNVGLLVCLGEAMNTIEDDVDWFLETIIPGVKDGLKALGRTDEPPILLRAHDTDAPLVMKKALPLYKNLYTMHKYNGESLTTYEPRGPWTQIHRDLSALGSVHISNVHILANLEPWRYGSPEFIRKTVHAMHTIHGANALHLYPQASYWDYPFTADKLADGSRLKQTDRDWIWFRSWGRYAWKVERNAADEADYWNNQFKQQYGVRPQDAALLLEAYNETGEIAPKLLRRFGITEGNRQTLLLGMFVSQLINPYKYTIYPGFYESCGPEGEKLIEYVEKEWKKIPHTGELPLDIIQQVKIHGDKAVEAIDRIQSVQSDREEFLRLKNDVYCYREFAYFFADKVQAARLVLDYQWSKDTDYLDRAVPLLASSLEHYRNLVELTKDNYLYANSMQTAQRRIPIGGDDAKNKTWEEMLVHYQREYDNFLHNLAFLKQGGSQRSTASVQPLTPAKVRWEDQQPVQFVMQEGVALFDDIPSEVQELAPELKAMQGVKFQAENQRSHGTSLSFSTDKPVHLLVGFFRDDQKKYADTPVLETDASANQYGQADVVIANALRIGDLPAVNVHVYTFQEGKHQLQLPRGMCLVLGFTEDHVGARNAGILGNGNEESADWLFY